MLLAETNCMRTRVHVHSIRRYYYRYNNNNCTFHLDAPA